MRRFVSILREYRLAQLAARHATNERLREANEVFSFLDNSLNGVMLHGNGFDNPESKLQEVMTTGDFSNALGEYVSRRVEPGYKTVKFAFEPIIKTDTLPNFMLATRYQRRQGLDDLEMVEEKGEARPGSYPDACKKQWRVYRWEKQWDFSMETLVNDDLGYFNDQALEMGLSARRTLEKFVSRMYTNAVSIARLVALGALYSTTGRLNSNRISIARMAFNQRTNAAGEPIAAELKYIVHHTGLVDVVTQIQNSELVPELATNGANVVRGTFTPIRDPYIVGVAPNLPWYAFSDWQASNTAPFVLARWQQLPVPMLARKKSDIETFTSFAGAGGPVSPIFGDFATGNIVVKVVDVWGTFTDAVLGNLVDERGAYYSAGTAA